jgi:hypothetical protein
VWRRGWLCPTPVALSGGESVDVVARFVKGHADWGAAYRRLPRRFFTLSRSQPLRLGRLCQRARAIGNAEPRLDDIHSPGFGPYEEGLAGRKAFDDQACRDVCCQNASHAPPDTRGPRRRLEIRFKSAAQAVVLCGVPSWSSQS